MRPTRLARRAWLACTALTCAGLTSLGAAVACAGCDTEGVTPVCPPVPASCDAIEGAAPTFDASVAADSAGEASTPPGEPATEGAMDADPMEDDAADQVAVPADDAAT
jgi:hypothetical protein